MSSDLMRAVFDIVEWALSKSCQQPSSSALLEIVENVIVGFTFVWLIAHAMLSLHLVLRLYRHHGRALRLNLLMCVWVLSAVATGLFIIFDGLEMEGARSAVGAIVVVVSLFVCMLCSSGALEKFAVVYNQMKNNENEDNEDDVHHGEGVETAQWCLREMVVCCVFLTVCGWTFVAALLFEWRHRTAPLLLQVIAVVCTRIETTLLLFVFVFMYREFVKEHGAVLLMFWRPLPSTISEHQINTTISGLAAETSNRSKTLFFHSKDRRRRERLLSTSTVSTDSTTSSSSSALLRQQGIHSNAINNNDGALNTSVEESEYETVGPQHQQRHAYIHEWSQKITF
eukprot:PhM_4_TR10547/c0_g1_i1/m.6070